MTAHVFRIFKSSLVVKPKMKEATNPVLCQSLKLGFIDLKLGLTVIPAQAGIQIAALGSRLRGNDVTPKRRFDKALANFTFLIVSLDLYKNNTRDSARINDSVDFQSLRISIR
jgi:hypothetical protein